jgi:predicted RNase H-like nuclease (RuvC/YqgF family)
VTIQAVYRGYRVRKKLKFKRSRKSQGDLKTLTKQMEAMAEENKDLRNTVTKHEKALRYLFEQVASLQRSLKE